MGKFYKCTNCGAPLTVHLGTTIGSASGVELWGCPNCGLVYYNLKRE